MVKLYRKDAAGRVREWSITKGDFGLIIHHGVLGGTQTRKVEDIDHGKAGRSLSEQIDSRYNSRISNQKKAGYVDSLLECETKPTTNEMGLPRPMLAQTYKDNMYLPKEFYLQHKFDGNRCIITKRNGKMIAYTRTGKPITSIGHILRCAESIPEGTFLDGELYLHGVPLQKLRSWISRSQIESSQLQFITYDMIAPEPFSQRLSALRELELENPIILAETTLVTSISLARKGIGERLSDALRGGYEGLILRQGSLGYEDSKRSRSLLKIKSWLDDEFTVEDIEISKDGWAVLRMTSASGKLFKATAPGSHDDKMEVADYPEHYIGKIVTIQYSNLTPDGVPFHPVAVAWRED